MFYHHPKKKRKTKKNVNNVTTEAGDTQSFHLQSNIIYHFVGHDSFYMSHISCIARIYTIYFFGWVFAIVSSIFFIFSNFVQFCDLATMLVTFISPITSIYIFYFVSHSMEWWYAGFVYNPSATLAKFFLPFLSTLVVHHCL